MVRFPINHPLRVVSTLIQFGYEPYPPVRRYSFLVHQYFYYYPGVLGYARKIINERGWKALYRGIGPALVEEVVCGIASDVIRPLVRSSINSLPLREVPGSVEETPNTVANITTTRATLVRGLRAFLIMSISGSVVEVIVCPFRVLTLRTIAQHVGEETLYCGFKAAVREIYNEEGLLGFYNGVVPAVLHQILAAFVYEGIVIVLEETAKILPVAIVGGGLAVLKGPIASYITRSYTYPFVLVSSIMAITGTPLKASKLNPPTTTWRGGWSHLKATGNLFRGASVWLPRLATNDPRNRL